MARAILSVSVDFDLALKVKERARKLQTTESYVVGEALRAYFGQREGSGSAREEVESENLHFRHRNGL